MSATIALVDDDRNLLASLAMALEAEGFRVRSYHDGAEALRGAKLFVPRAALPEVVEDDEYYLTDLVGLAVELADGTAWGTVHALHDFGAGDILEVARTEGETVMLPFTRETVPVVDIAGGRLVIDPLEETSEEISAKDEAE